jgi:NAD(P)-dependent dehydrogenase (short-subunit alcohol dehydrogenase family)
MSLYRPSLLTGKHILITGGGTGLGRGMAGAFLALGAEVSICGRRKGVCDDTAAALMAEHGGTVNSYGCDIRDAQAVDAMIAEIFAKKPLTGLVNNAAGNFISPTEAISPRGFDAIANIVMHGTFYVTQAVGKRWIEQGWAPGDPMRSVVSIIVSWVLNGGPYVVPSTMSKSAIHGMTMSLATEWARFGIRLNAIGPGEIPTEGMSKRLNPGEDPGERSKQRNPMGRTGSMDELNNLATFLQSNGCDWLTGQSIMMDGGGYLATGGNFFELRHWTDAQWKTARESIEAQNKKDRAARTV